MEKRLRVGVIGAGWVATARHIPCYQRLENVEVVAVLDRHIEKAREAARRFSIPRAYDDADEFLAQGLDVVSICTPPWTHAELAIQAFQHGCHVFTEKPMAMSVTEARSMAEAAKAADRLLCVSHNFLFSRSMRKAEAMIARGELGEVKQVIGLQLSSPERRLPVWYSGLPGGLFFDEAPHLLYLMRRFLGEGVQVESASVARNVGGEQPIASAQARLAGTSAQGTLSMTFDAPVSEWLLWVVGAKKVLIFDIFRDILVTLRSDGSHGSSEILKNSLLSGADLAAGFVTSGFLHSTNKLFYGHETLIEAFVTAVRRGRPSPVSADDGVAIVEMMERVLQASGVAPGREPVTRARTAKKGLLFTVAQRRLVRTPRRALTSPDAAKLS